MAKIFSKVTGMDVWAYDVSRRPDKSLSNGRPKLDHLSVLNKQGDAVNPATHEPTEYLNVNVNQFRYVFDINSLKSSKVISSFVYVFFFI